ncbi:MAG: hypothetical protein ACTSR9_13970 [Candidatus Thorarchaeota archaeon]
MKKIRNEDEFDWHKALPNTGTRFGLRVIDSQEEYWDMAAYKAKGKRNTLRY